MVVDIELLDKFSIYQSEVSKKVYLPNRDMSEVNHIGSNNIFTRSTLFNVFYLPQFKCNLMSISRVTRELGIQ